MTDVVIAGVGQTPVGEHWTTSLRELALNAIEAAIQDAGGIQPQALFVSNVLSPTQIHDIVALIPRDWLENEPGFDDVGAHRKAYAAYLVSRLEASTIFVEEAVLARQKCV